MRFSIRNFRGLEGWAEFDDSRISVLYGPNFSGKSGLVQAFLLLREQRDPFRLSFSGGAHGIPTFLDAVRDRDPEGRIDLIIACSVDAAAGLFPQGSVRPAPVLYDFEFGLSYASDTFDGGASGILVEASLVHLRDGERVELFHARADESGGEFHLALEEALRLPFVHERIVGADTESADYVAAADRSIELASGLAAALRGEAAERAKELLESLKTARRTAALNRELERIVLPLPAEDRFRPFKFRIRDRTSRFEATERKYLRALADILVAESLTENGIRSMRSRETGREIRPSFYAVFYEVLAAAGFIAAAEPPFLARFPVRLPSRDRPGPWSGLESSTALGSLALVRKAEEDYAALLRDAANFTLCRKRDGSASIEDARLDERCGTTVITYREAHEGASLVSEGGTLDPGVLDLEARREALRSILSEARIAGDLEFFPSASEDRAICLAREGRRDFLGDQGEGVRRFVLVAASLLYLPWGSHVVIEDPEAGLDPERLVAMASLLRRLVEKTGATIVVETKSADFIAALGPWRAEAGKGERKHRRERLRATEEEEIAPKLRIRESEDGEVRVMELARRPVPE